MTEQPQETEPEKEAEKEPTLDELIERTKELCEKRDKINAAIAAHKKAMQKKIKGM